MSEQQPRSNSRLQNFEANKRAHEKAEFEASLYGEAGETDFSDEAKLRVEEADAYERHLETITERGDAESADDYVNPYMDNLHHEALDMNDDYDAEQAAAADAEQARINELMQSDVRVRQMVMIAHDIARVSSTEFTADTEARLSAALTDKQDRLEELLLKFSENNELSPADADTIMGKIIDMTEATREPAAEVEQPAERSLLPDYTAEEIASRLEAVQRVKAEQEAAEQVSEQESHDTPDEPLSTEGIEDITPEQAAETPALDGESQEEYEARNGVESDDEPLSAEGIEDIEIEDDEEDQDGTQPAWKRIGARLHPASIAARAQARIHDIMRKRRSNETNAEVEDGEESREGMTTRTKVIIGLGVVGAGLAVALVANKYGIDFKPGSSAADAKDALKRQGGGSNHGGNALNWNNFDPSARRIDSGEGFYSTFKQMGIPKENWSEILQDAGPKLGKMGEAYYDNGAKEWRISHQGVFSNDALQAIAKSARADGVKLK